MRVCLCVRVLQTHSNETIGSIRWKIAEHLSCPVDNVQIFANDSVVSLNDSVSDRLCVHLVILYILLFFFISLPHDSIFFLSQSCFSPEASINYILQITAQLKHFKQDDISSFFGGLVLLYQLCSRGNTPFNYLHPCCCFLSLHPFTDPPPSIS